MKIIPIAVSILLLIFNSSLAQSNDPAPAQSKPIILMNGTAHLGDGRVINNSVIVFKQEKITSVADASLVKIDPTGHQVIDISGKHVYPGFILPNTELGLREVDAVSATLDVSEVGNLNPNVRAIVAYNTDSEIITTFKHNGILTAQIVPNSGTVKGTSSIVQLDAWNWEDAIIRADDGVHLNWPERKLPPRWWLGETEYRENENYDHQSAELRKLLHDASNYTGDIKNIKLEAMKGLFDGKKQLFIHEDQAKSIIESVQEAQKAGVKKIVIVGGKEVGMIVEFIQEHRIPIILNGVHRLPERDEEDVSMPYKTPVLLHNAGIKFCIAYGGSTMSERNLPFLAGTAAAYGMPKEEALKTITSHTAEILGLHDMGILKNGYRATLFVSEGDALDMRTNQVIYAFIDGRQVKINGMQEVLHQRYKKKYGQKQ